MRFHSFAKAAAALALIATFLAACVVVDDGPGPMPPGPGPGPDRGAICTREYAPVCGERRGDRQTFGNACIARAEGFRIVDQGECRPQRPQRPPQQAACTQQYQPVCAQRGGDTRTFGNSCMADLDGYRVVHQGECRPAGRPGGGGSPGGRPDVCTREYAPVCARRGNDVRTFGNSCEADVADYRVIRPGSC